MLALRMDLADAGAQALGGGIQIDDHLITSRNPDDIPAFTQAPIKTIEQS
jgi:protease I